MPFQWYSLIHSAKISGEPYKVVEMSQNDFYDFKQISKNLNWNKNTQNGKPYIARMKEVYFGEGNPYILNYKLMFEEPAKQLILFKTCNIRDRLQLAEKYTR